MSDLLKQVFSYSTLGMWSAVALVIFFITMSIIALWTFRPSAKKSYEQQSLIAVDEVLK